jgi:nucleotide-binding universal stress UspA family protein
MTSAEASRPVSLVLVGVDGSDNSLRALRWAGDVAAGLDAEVLAVHAVGLLDQLHHDEVVEQFETTWCAPLTDCDVRHRKVLLDGPPSMTMLRLIEQEPVDLVVVGSRGIGGFPELQLGSTSLQLVHHCPVPVTIIPPG